MSATKPRLIIHNSTSPFNETYVDVEGAKKFFEGYHGTDEDLFMMLAKAAVKAGNPFWEIEWEVMNQSYDPTTRDAWVLDASALGEPTGYGEKTNV